MNLDKTSLAKLLDQLPAFPQSVNKILELTATIDVAPKDLVAVVERDMVLTARVLKLVNSPFFGLSREVTSVQHAVVYVGINTIKNVAISVAMSGSLPKANKAGLDMDRFWKQSLSVGVIAKMLAEKAGVNSNDTADYFVTGLLHNIGKIIFAHFFPDQYKAVLAQNIEKHQPTNPAEKHLFGMDHSEIGAMLAEEWQLPENLVNGIKNHDNFTQSITDNRLPLTILVASQIYKRLYQPDNLVKALPENIVDWMGSDLDQMIASLSQLDEEIEKAMVFIK